MVHWPSSRRNGSAEIAWYAVTAATLLLIGGLIRFGPASALDAQGKPYNPFPPMTFVLLRGLALTGQIVGLSLLCSLLGGILVGIGRVSRYRVANFAASVYVETIRGVPLLVLLFMIYFGLNQFLPPGQKLSAFASAVLGLSICYSAFMGEAVRAGIEAIPPEEIEAGVLEGTTAQVFWHVILPRALRTVLPAVANEFIALLKDSSLVSILAITELTRAGQEFASSKFLYFETYTMVALIYLALTLALSRVVRQLEKSWAA
ncbi:MAG: amino acid ABC transporter permease [Candidatus Sumerlaeaceae bacterium]|nr:amino acid ABC transporter permease [Candidatus Sumerlaeaceae bacterium]